jgi:ketosteroid isomerase-like protein
VIAVVHLWGRGKQSRVAVEQRRSHLWTRRDGKLRRRRIYAAKADALEAAGLRE